MLTGDVFDASAMSTVHVVVIVGALNLKPGGSWAKLQFANQADVNQRLHDGVDRLDGDLGEGTANVLQQFVSGGVWHLF
jgi:hypothetical protein